MQTSSDSVESPQLVRVLETKRLRETVMMTVIVMMRIDGGHWRWRIDVADDHDDDDNEWD